MVTRKFRLTRFSRTIKIRVILLISRVLRLVMQNQSSEKITLAWNHIGKGSRSTREIVRKFRPTMLDRKIKIRAVLLISRALRIVI